MRPDVMIVRHGETGAPHQVAEAVDCPVINAGDGTGEHPTQALLDALTMRRRKGRIEGLEGGDLRRHPPQPGGGIEPQAASQARREGAAGRARLPCCPPTAAAFPPSPTSTRASAGADVVMMLRIQRERMEESVSGSLADFHARYGLTMERLERAAPDAIVMHPGPMNRGVEIDGDVADHPTRSAIREQVEMGVAVRMAVLDVLTRERASDGQSASDTESVRHRISRAR